MQGRHKEIKQGNKGEKEKKWDREMEQRRKCERKCQNKSERRK